MPPGRILHAGSCASASRRTVSERSLPNRVWCRSARVRQAICREEPRGGRRAAKGLDPPQSAERGRVRGSDPVLGRVLGSWRFRKRRSRRPRGPVEPPGRGARRGRLASLRAPALPPRGCCWARPFISLRLRVFAREFPPENQVSGGSGASCARRGGPHACARRPPRPAPTAAAACAMRRRSRVSRPRRSTKQPSGSARTRRHRRAVSAKSRSRHKTAFSQTLD